MGYKEGLTTVDVLSYSVPLGERFLVEQLMKEVNLPSLQEVIKGDLPDLDGYLKSCKEEDYYEFFSIQGEKVKWGKEPHLVLAKTLRFYEDLCKTSNNPLSLEEAVAYLYLTLHLTDLRGENAVALSKVEQAKREDLPSDYLNPAKALNVENPEIAAVVNRHFGHLVLHHTGAVALPLGLMEACFFLLKNNDSFKSEYLDFVSTIIETNKTMKMHPDTYLLDYLCHRLFKMGRLSGRRMVILGDYVDRPWCSLESYDFLSWRGVLEEAFTICQNRGEKFFNLNPNNFLAETGIVREFAGRYKPFVEETILIDAQERGIQIDKAVVLGLGQAGFEAAEVSKRLGLKQIYGVDILPFPDQFDLMPRIFRPGVGFVYREKDSRSLAWGDESNVPAGIPVMGLGSEKQPFFWDKTLWPKANLAVTGPLPNINIMIPEEFKRFQEERSRIKPFQADLLGNLEACLPILGKCDVVYLRGTLCLYSGKEALELIRNTLSFGNPDGFYLVIQDQTSLKGCPFSQGIILRVDPCGPKVKLTPLLLKFRPFFNFRPGEMYFRSRWLQVGPDLKENLLHYWL